MNNLCRRRRQEGPVFWIDQDLLAVFDARAAQRLDATNFSDLTMLDGFTDAVLGRPSEPVTWSQLRTGWTAQLRQLTSAPGLAGLVDRLDEQLDASLGRTQDLVWLAERLTTEMLVPSIVSGLDPSAHRRIVREVHSKIAFVFSDVEPPRSPMRQRWAMTLHQLLAGWEVRRELQGRQYGRRPRQTDLLDPVVDLIPQLGIGRAVDAVTTLLTAITGSPGAATACLMYEMSRRPDWLNRMEAEFASLPVETIFKSPVRAAPLTARFVREVMRIWSSPSVVLREARVDMEVEGVSLKQGQRYVLSPWMIHNDERYWRDPDQFDPDRWLAEAPKDECPHSAYVPFGWAPKSCIGANLGIAMMMLVAQRLCTRYRMELSEDHSASMMVASVVRPIGFHGRITRR